MDPYIGEIRMFAGMYAPRGWALCNGQLLSISQYTALFSILGTTYGGDGRVTFGLPDLRGRGPVHAGQGPGLTNRTLGEIDGVENVTLALTEVPAHTHTATTRVNASARADASSPAAGVFADTAGAVNMYASAPDGATTMNGRVEGLQVGIAGGSQPHANLQPLLCVNFIIALVGVFPPRN